MGDVGAASDAPGFRNDPITADGLPRLDDVDVEPLDPALVTIRMIACAVAAVVIVLATAIVAVLTAAAWAVGVGVVMLVLVALLAALLRLEVASMGYAARAHDFSFREGVISRSVVTVPFARVQDVAIERGPLERWFGLATLQLRTAGGEISVPGIRLDTAGRLKSLVVDRAGRLADAETDETETGEVAGGP